MLRDQVLQAKAGQQTVEAARAAVVKMLTGESVLSGLRRMREGNRDHAEDALGIGLTDAEFDVAVVDDGIRRRMHALASEGIGAELFDVEQTGTGRRGRMLQLRLLPA